ncbi:Chromosome partition protein Smc [uncultured archaeon]|nr:Chromosome partition protein Smc [uncultured archaeon]
MILVIEKSREIIEQIFKEKFSSSENNEKPSPKIKESFPWSQYSQTNNNSDNNNLFNDLISKLPKNKNTSTFSSVPSSNDVLELIPKERNHLQIPVEANKDSNIQQVQSNDIMSDDKIIDSLKQEAIEYKSKINAIQPEILRYEQTIHSLKDELAEYKNRQSQTPLEIMPQYQQVIHSLKEELAEYKSKLDLMISERNQQSNMDVLRAELAEYKGRQNVMQPEVVQSDQMINSLRKEVLRLKENLNSMILK